MRCVDDRMINVINVAFIWNSKRNSVQMKFQTLHCVARIFQSARSLRLYVQILMTVLNWRKIAILMAGQERVRGRERGGEMRCIIHTSKLTM